MRTVAAMRAWRLGVVLVFTAALAAPARGQAPAVSAPVLKWQHGGCFASWCQTGC